MSGKYAKKNKRKTTKRKNIVFKLWIAVFVAALVLAAVGLASFLKKDAGQPEEPASAAQTETTEAKQEQAESAFPIYLQRGLEITQIKDYTGIYMEDGTDEAVSGVLMILVRNSGEQPVQYAEITLDCNGEKANFSVSTLNPGASAVLLEKNRMAYDPDAAYGSAECTHVAFFNEPLSLCEDKLQIQRLDGALNITNISDTDLDENITIYYKYYSNGIYYGGITYRITLEGGLKAGELRQLMVKHFYDPGSEIVMVTCGAG